MIDKSKFYSDDDSPTKNQQKEIWKGINRNINPRKKIIFHISDMRSFYYGIAASFIFIFAVIGVYSTAKNVLYNMKPEEVKLDNAYQSAIREFQKVVPSVAFASQKSENAKAYVNLKEEQLRYIDENISTIKSETGTTDLSPLKQLRLRQLYAAKLKALQEIIDNGEIDI
ncbi:MAG: hypothetical protein WC557_07665 [Ignavibacteriaceae bacterium]